MRSSAPDLRLPAALGAACLVAAGLSLLAPSAPTTDSWGWIVWGREMADLELATIVGGAPSWKPLPVLLTTPLSLFGDAAPDLWLVLARASALLSLVCGYSVGRRLAGPWAGALAVGALVLSSGFVRSFAHGYSEPLAIAMVLGAVERHLAGHRGQALLLGAGAALARPEAWPVLALYGLACWRRRELGVVLGAAAIVAVPVLWVVPDWVGSGDPLHGGEVASSILRGEIGVTLEQAATIVPLPFALTAIAGALLAWRRGDRTLPWLSAIAVAWSALVAVLMLAGYPPSSRYFLLPAALLCVVGGAGCVMLIGLAPRGRARVASALVLAAAALPFAAGRAVDGFTDAGAAIRRARLAEDLRAVAKGVGSERLRRCRMAAMPRGLAWVKGALAWELDLPLRRVRELPTSAGPYVQMLAEPRDHGPPPRPRERTVEVRAPAGRFVLFEPFAGAAVRVQRPRGEETSVVARIRRWTVRAPADGCARPREERVSRAP